MRFIDRQALWIAEHWSPAWQMRSGVIAMYVALAFIPGFFIAPEAAILAISILTMLYGGPQVIATARLAMQQAETDEDVEELKHR